MKVDSLEVNRLVDDICGSAMREDNGGVGYCWGVGSLFVSHLDWIDGQDLFEHSSMFP